MRIWNPNFYNIPLNKKIYLLCKDKDTDIAYEYIGVITIKQNCKLCRECLEGDPKIFYNSIIEYWSEYNDTEEVPTS